MVECKATDTLNTLLNGDNVSATLYYLMSNIIMSGEHYEHCMPSKNWVFEYISNGAKKLMTLVKALTEKLENLASYAVIANDGLFTPL